jgi:hypothetical protein
MTSGKRASVRQQNMRSFGIFMGSSCVNGLMTIIVKSGIARRMVEVKPRPFIAFTFLV